MLNLKCDICKRKTSENYNPDESSEIVMCSECAFLDFADDYFECREAKSKC